ncbi:MAG: SPOR domain-containing protein [Vicingaceae bacterium]|nr:SPOR domain-containing protein [Vicingaceae bacterium]
MKLINLICLILVFFHSSQAQESEVFDEKNQAQAFAILSAQYSKDAYLLTQKSYFSNNIYDIKQNCDTAIELCQTAIVYADSAFNAAYDTCEYGMMVMLQAKDYQLRTIAGLEKLKSINDAEWIHSLSEKSMYASANAIVDAYSASLFFEWTEVLDSNIETTDSIPLTEESEASDRELTRLEADEYSYMTVKELYGKRLVEIDNELALLEQEKNGTNDERLDMAIAEINMEKLEYLRKMKGSEDRLISVRNDLSEEMLQIVHKDIFTTDKKGFYNKNVPIPTENKIPDGLIFKVQIGFFKSQLDPTHFDGIFPLSSQKVDDTYYRYEAGNFSNYNDAKKAQKAVVDKGYSDSFVIAYFNGEKISIHEALKKEKATD